MELDCFHNLFWCWHLIQLQSDWLLLDALNFRLLYYIDYGSDETSNLWWNFCWCVVGFGDGDWGCILPLVLDKTLKFIDINTNLNWLSKVCPLIILHRVCRLVVGGSASHVWFSFLTVDRSFFCFCLHQTSLILFLSRNLDLRGKLHVITESINKDPIRVPTF